MPDQLLSGKMKNARFKSISLFLLGRRDTFFLLPAWIAMKLKELVKEKHIKLLRK